jgi:DeoR family transcriptional regulator of aga operon/DeoR family fructose operon transcriptional repressor
VYAPERRRLIEGAMEEHGRASVADLASRFGVSQVTIRKDLELLEADQRLIRTHGGAIASERSQAELAFEIRERRQRGEKQAIGAAAASMVASGDSIALDASSTALHLARNLRAHTELSVVTNGLHIAAELAALPGITVLMPGGRLRWEAFSLVGSWGDVLLSGVNIQRAFLGATGFTLEAGLTDVTEEEAAIKRHIVAAARQVIAVIDHTKWDRVGVATFCPLERISLIITDTSAPARLVAAARERGVEVLQVEPVAQSAGMEEFGVNGGVGFQPLRRVNLGSRQRRGGMSKGEGSPRTGRPGSNH